MPHARSTLYLHTRFFNCFSPPPDSENVRAFPFDCFNLIKVCSVKIINLAITFLKIKVFLLVSFTWDAMIPQQTFSQSCQSLFLPAKWKNISTLWMVWMSSFRKYLSPCSRTISSRELHHTRFFGYFKKFSVKLFQSPSWKYLWRSLMRLWDVQQSPVF